MIEYQNEKYKLKMVRRAGRKLHLHYRTMISSVSNNFSQRNPSEDVHLESSCGAISCTASMISLGASSGSR